MNGSKRRPTDDAADLCTRYGAAGIPDSPTRRANIDNLDGSVFCGVSDLARHLLFTSCEGGARPRSPTMEAHMAWRTRNGKSTRYRAKALISLAAMAGGVALSLLDRKSTRLNSSH